MRERTEVEGGCGKKYPRGCGGHSGAHDDD